MIWHIFRKDALLLWPLVLLVTAVHAVEAMLFVVTGRFGEPDNLRTLANMLMVIGLIAMGVLTVTALHQDAIPGVRQDWLVRPVRRTDLIIAKLMFVVLLVIGPLVAVDLCRGLVEGLSFSASLRKSAIHGAAVLALVGSVGLIIGAITKNAMQALVAAAIGATIIFGIAGIIEQLMDVGAGLLPSNLHWLLSTAWYVVASVVALVVLPLQYLQRKTKIACGIASVGVIAATLLPWMPWHTAFALQQSLRDPMPASAIAVNFVPTNGRLKSDAGLVLPAGLIPPLQTVFLPLEFSGLDSNSHLMVDGVLVRVVDADNKVRYNDSHNLSVFGGGGYLSRKRLEVLPPVPGEQTTNVYSAIWLSKNEYDKIKNLNVRLELEYSITLMRTGPSYSIASLAAGQKVEGLGLCDTRIDSDGDEIEIACISPQKPPSCFAAFMQQSASNLKNAEFHICQPQYGTPPEVRGAFPSFGGDIPFRDLTGQAHYAVDGTRLEGAQIVINSFEPQAHFTRKLVIPSIRLSGWEQEPSLARQKQ